LWIRLFVYLKEGKWKISEQNILVFLRNSCPAFRSIHADCSFLTMTARDATAITARVVLFVVSTVKNATTVFYNRIFLKLILNRKAESFDSAFPV
jgi:hypothetical protein